MSKQGHPVQPHGIHPLEKRGFPEMRRPQSTSRSKGTNPPPTPKATGKPNAGKELPELPSQTTKIVRTRRNTFRDAQKSNNPNHPET